MQTTRRQVLAGLTAIAGLSALPRMLCAETTLGDARLTTISDGYLDLPGGFAFDGLPQEELAKILAEYNVSRDRYTPECNLAIYRDGTHTVLFDVGSGPDFMPTAGNLVDGLEAAGVGVDDITHVLFTHAHPDHIWGLLDEFDDPLFPDATYMIGRREWDYWWDPDTVDRIGENRAAFAVGARRRLEAIEDTVERFDDGFEILPGIAAFGSYGHTPGHMAFELRSGSETAMIAGDAILNPHVSFLRPDWEVGSDQDPEFAAKSRRRVLDRVTQEHMTLVGFHLPNGGIGRAERSGDAYRFVQEDI